MKRSLFLIPFIAFSCYTLPVRADIYVDNKAGNDSNSGKSPDKAVNTLAAGMKKLYVAKESKLIIKNNGTPYYECLRITRGGSPSSPLTIEGNNAVISGLKEIPSSKWLKKNGAYFFPHKRMGAERPYLLVNGNPVPRGKSDIKNLEPFSHYWAKHGVYFKPAEGKKIKDYKIFGTMVSSGVAISNSHYITCRNITAEYFCNDGFNVHGNCQNLIFENITGRFNGDDGFSVHEDVGSLVRNGYFHGNDFGIQDVNAARSEYYGIQVENNRRVGVHFSGGIHTLINAVVKGNKEGQIKVNSGKADHVGLMRDNPAVTGMAYIKDVYVLSGNNYGIYAGNSADVIVMNCFIANVPTGIICDSKADLTLKGIMVRDCSRAMIENRSPETKINFSLLAPGIYIFNGKVYDDKDFKSWLTTCKTGKNILNKLPDPKSGPVIFDNGKRHHFYAGPRMPAFAFKTK